MNKTFYTILAFLVSYVVYLIWMAFLFILSNNDDLGVEDILSIMVFPSFYGIPIVLIATLIGEAIIKIERANSFTFFISGCFYGLIFFVLSSANTYADSIEWYLIIVSCSIGIVIFQSFYFIRKKGGYSKWGMKYPIGILIYFNKRRKDTRIILV
ncbi:hypothetical protein [Bacillus sp. B1-b2]|uniref:hypothetical protein n=1 Tax=Bacillus sp. B1-b2 TaxID=2653201 RepID=UPI0012622AAA|nr:hypothetical protein [Bacillus sp. B1-b2]KAB7672849.1 hypothetical protein F9279_00010 [Bacillus sp. B1-b2]